MKSKSEINRKYNELWDKADKLIKQYNPCSFDSKGVCICFQKVDTRYRCTSCTSCCSGCSLKCKGKKCTVKNLSCKLFVCSYINRSELWEFYEDMAALRLSAYRFGFSLYHFYQPKSIDLPFQIQQINWRHINEYSK